jgi:thiol-disulfide isomerase/thioredoxin
MQEFAGRVIDTAGKAISDVRVGVVIGTVGAGSGDTGLSATSDQEGRFVIKLPIYESKEKLVLSLVLNKDGFAGEDSRNHPIPKEPTNSIDVGTLTLEQGNSYRLRVVDEHDQPIAGATVEPSGSYALRRLEIRTDAEGRGVLRDLPTGVVSISVSHGEMYLHSKIVVNSADDKSKELVVMLKATPSVPAAKPATVGRKKPIAVGQIAPELAVGKWTDGKTHQLSDYRDRVVVLDFWGVWCGGCITSIPMLQELEAKYESKGVVFLGIHTADGTLDQINDLKKLHNWKTVTGIDQGKEINDGETAARFSVSGYPTVMVIDGAGKIAFNSGIPPASRDEFMKELEQIAKSQNIPWPLPEKEDSETIAQMNRIFAAKFSQEIDKALAVSKTSK